MKNIVLVGFMGTGKTATGKLLAKKLGKKYVSTDELIERDSGMRVKDLFAAKGEKYFRKLEKKAVRKVAASSDQVVDSGGGVVLDSGNMAALRRSSVIVCLWADPDTIWRRTKRYGARPLLNVRDPRKKIIELLEYRRPFYGKADFHVNTAGSSMGKVASRIVKVWNSINPRYSGAKEMIRRVFVSFCKNRMIEERHSLRVTLFSVALARKLGLEESQIEDLKVAALLHDMGKIEINPDILLKNGKLTKKEFSEVKKHPSIAGEKLKKKATLWRVLPAIVSHHENYDGTGYPAGLKGEEIPLSARIIAVADIYEALTSDRSYRRAFSKKDTIDIIKGERGRKLDPRLTDIFLRMIGKNEVDGIEI